jgi:hypothetical protein
LVAQQCNCFATEGGSVAQPVWVAVVENAGGEYDGSCKVPDLQFLVQNAKGTPQPKFALEVGLSETYEQLVDDAKLLLEGTDSISVVVLAKLTETPKYRCPIHQPTLKKLEQSNIPKEYLEIRLEDFDAVETYGPVTYKMDGKNIRSIFGGVEGRSNNFKGKDGWGSHCMITIIKLTFYTNAL